ncbi:MAG: hypothetical protein RL650_1957 [Pseudomonadota bacterium]
MHIDAHIGPLGVDVRALATFGAEAIGHGIFDFERCKIEAGERTVLRCDFNLESLLGGKPNFPSDGAGSVVQIFFAAVKSLRQLNEHTLRQSAVQVQSQRIAP